MIYQASKHFWKMEKEKIISIFLLFVKLLITASTITWIGFWSVSKWIISIACFVILTAISFFPLFLPCIMRELVSLSTIGHCAFLKRLTEYLPAVWGT